MGGASTQVDPVAELSKPRAVPIAQDGGVADDPVSSSAFGRCSGGPVLVNCFPYDRQIDPRQPIIVVLGLRALKRGVAFSRYSHRAIERVLSGRVCGVEWIVADVRIEVHLILIPDRVSLQELSRLTRAIMTTWNFPLASNVMRSQSVD